MQQQRNTMAESDQNHGHILVVTRPLQGHAAPLMKLSGQIAKLGTKVTFLKVLAAGESAGSLDGGIRMISTVKGGEDDGPAYLEEFILQRSTGGDRISGVILDTSVAFMVEVAKKMGLKTAVSWGSTPGCLALLLRIPHLVRTGFIDSNGTPLKKNGTIQLLPNMPEMAATDLQWYFPSNKDKQISWFHLMKRIIHHMSNADMILCNWFHDLDPSVIALAPTILSIGPILTAGDRRSSGSFYSEDSSCLAWLDTHPPNSVIYVAFGSTSRFSRDQLDELARGLELTGRPFLWVAWSGLTDGPAPACSEEFVERVASRGKVVDWAPQEAVLGHPATACFVTHCGWGSFMEGLSQGVPFLCWPYFGDQMYTMRCICDAWKVGLRLKGEGDGLVLGEEIRERVEEILSHAAMRENAARWKRVAGESIKKGGSSFMNFQYLVQQMKF